MAGKEKYRYFPSVQNDLSRLRSIHSLTQIDIHEDQIDAVIGAEQLDRFFRAMGQDDLVPESFERNFLAVGKEGDFDIGILLHDFDRFFAGIYGHDLVAVFFQEHFLAHGDDRFVFHEQDRLLFNIAHGDAFLTVMLNHRRAIVDCQTSPRTDLLVRGRTY